jgi:hypothetical protein
MSVQAMWLLVCLMAAGACGPAHASGLPDGLPELEMRDAIESQAIRLYAAGDLAGLDAQSEAYLAGATRTSSGLWVSGLFAGGVEVAIVRPKPTTEAGWDELEQRMRSWVKQHPQSPLAHLMVAEAMTRRGWSIRGGGYAHAVSPEAWAPFREHMKRARDYLVSNAEVAARHPQYYAALVQVDTWLGVDDKQVQADFEAGTRHHPGYYPLYFAMLNHLMPKWGGGPREIEAFARAAVEATRATEGESMYARIYWFAAQNGYDDTIFLTSFARWDRMRAGFEDVIARFPDQWNLQNYAHFACEAGDMETLQALLPRLQAPIASAWQGRASFEECRRLAGQIDT